MPQNSRFPWKQNFQKMPQSILPKVRGLASDYLVVATPLRLPSNRIKAGQYEHIGIIWQGDSVHFDEQVLPNPAVGRWSKINIEGKHIKLKHLPKVERSWSVETPNYGDWSLGSHEVTFSQQVYQRRLIPAKHLGLNVELIGQEPGPDPIYIFRVSVHEVLDRRTPDFEETLLYDLNLLQENTGGADVFVSSASIADYLGTLFVDWEILPPGDREGNIAIILRGVRGLSDEQKRNIEQRYRVIEKLRPQDFVVGSSGFRRYFGARFSENLVVFENVQYGNAIYVMGADWEELSKLSRTELLKKAELDFTRIPHVSQWEDRLREEIRKRRSKR